MTGNHPHLSAQLSTQLQVLVRAGWLETDRSDDWDRDLGDSVIVTLRRGQDVLDVELFDSGWLQVFAYSTDYEPIPDKPDEPVFVLQNAMDLAKECDRQGWLK